MKTKLFPILMLLICLFSCKDDDLSPEAKIQGKYEYLYQDDQSWGGGLKDFVNTLELKADGTFYREDVTKEIDSDQVLGYRRYGSGTYTLKEGKVELHHDEMYAMGVADLNYVPKEELTKKELEGYSEEYTILKNFSELEFVCPSNAFCTDLPLYTKID